MPMNYKIVHELDETKWRKFVDSHPHGNIFHTPEFFQIFQATKRHRPELWICLDETDRILVFFMPVHVSLGGSFLCKKLTTRSISYGGILLDQSVIGIDATKHLLSEYHKKYGSKVLFTEIRNLSDTSFLNLQGTFLDNKFRYEDYLNYLIDVHDKNPDELLQSFGKNIRKRIRHEMRVNKIKIHEVSTSEQLKTVFDLLRLTYAHKHVPLADFSLFQNTFQLLYPKNEIKILLASVDGQFVATSIELFFKDVVYGWYAGSDRRYGRYYVNEILMWHILKSAVESGYRVYDFGGAGYPEEEYGVRNFKAKFGGTLVNYGRYKLIDSRFRCIMATIGYTMYKWLPNLKSH